MPRRHPRALLALALLLPFTVAAQAAATALHLPIDLAAIASWVLKGAAALVGGAVLWLLKLAVQSFNDMSGRFDKLDTSIAEVKSDVKTVTQELFGATGENGMRSELREIRRDARRTTQILAGHEVTLARLADKAGIQIKPLEASDD